MNQSAFDPKRPPTSATRTTRTKVAALVPVFGWAVILFALSSIPGQHIPPVYISLADKAVHCFVYAVLGAVCYRALVLLTQLRGGTAVLVAVALALAYGVSDEIHQMFVPQRSPELFDVLADAIGGTIGAISTHLFLSRRRGGRPRRASDRAT